MLTSIKQLDQILRGQATRLSALRGGVIEIPAGGLSVVLVALGMVYGVCMGLYAVIERGSAGLLQMLATTLKVPLLFFLTLLVTFPSLYVFNALVGSRLSAKSVLRLLVASLGVILTVLASFGTIVAFFSVSTNSYPFMLLLNVIVFAVSGLLGLAFLLQTLHRLTLVQDREEWEEERRMGSAGMETPQGAPSQAPTYEVAPGAGVSGQAHAGAPGVAPPPLPGGVPEGMPPAMDRGALDRAEGRMPSANVRTVFKIWVVVFGLVGAQMAWVLRPFLGNPKLEFSWFRARESNFFEAVLRALGSLLGT